MEGLILAKILEDLAARLPARNLGWVFPDETTAALLLEPEARDGGGPFNLVLTYRPPAPAVYVNRDRISGDASSPFQRALAARARGPLLEARQLKLDRVAALEFGAAPGFVEAPPVRLIFELTGRNANLLLVEPGESAFTGRILNAAREITSSRNRFRQVRPGLPYQPPPPYDKLDPRTAGRDRLRAALRGRSSGAWHSVIDGLGPLLAREVERRAGLNANDALEGDALERVIAALETVARDPTLGEGVPLGERARERAHDERLIEARRALRGPLEKRLTLLERQLDDVSRAREAAVEAITDREFADTLLAYAHLVPSGASSARLPNLYGDGDVEVPLDPALDAVANANRLYARARRREDVMLRLEEREPDLLRARADVAALLERLDAMNEAELDALQGGAAEREARPAVGARFVTRGGFEVLVGRNSKENEFLTHRLARSTDVWLHAQGYPGSHAIVRANNREVPFADILEAAGIAAWHSRARRSGNVPVDYTLVKHVWRPKGARAGQVHYTQQRTVFVDPIDPSAAGTAS